MSKVSKTYLIIAELGKSVYSLILYILFSGLIIITTINIVADSDDLKEYMIALIRRSLFQAYNGSTLMVDPAKK